MSKTLELELRLGKENPIGDFSRDWINNSTNTEEQMWQVYCILRYHGLSRDKIASRAELLGMNPETIERNYQRLSKLGLKDDKIASRAELLGRDPETIERNYQSHIRLLRQNHEDRSSGRELLTDQAQLLGIPNITIEATVQYLHDLGIDYNDGILLGTTAQLKRKKMAWMLREIFSYRERKNKKQAIKEMRQFVRENPRYLTKSINALERAKPKMLERLVA